MSAEAETHILRICEQREDLRPIHCHILQLLAIRHDRDYRIAWPSVVGMARESHYSTRAIYSTLDELTELGILHRDYGELPRKDRRQRTKLGNRYRFPGLDDIPEDEHPRLLGGRRPASHDAADEAASSEPDDVQMNRADEPDDVQMNGGMKLERGPDEPDDAVQMNRADEPETHVTGNTEPAGENRQKTPAHGTLRAGARAGGGDDGPAGDESSEPDAEAVALWRATLEQLQAQTSAAHYAVYLAPTVGLTLCGDTLTVLPGSVFHVQWLEHRFGPAIAETVERVAGRRLRIQWRSLATAPPGHQARERPHAAPAEALAGAAR